MTAQICAQIFVVSGPVPPTLRGTVPETGKKTTDDFDCS